MSGMLDLPREEAEKTGEKRILAGRLSEVRVTGSAAALATAGLSAQTAHKALAAGFAATFDDTGVLTRVRVREGTDQSARDLLRTVAVALQQSAPPRPGVASWRGEEAAMTGRWQTTYIAQNEALSAHGRHGRHGGRTLRKTFTAAATSAMAYEESGETTLAFDATGGLRTLDQELKASMSMGVDDHSAWQTRWRTALRLVRTDSRVARRWADELLAARLQDATQDRDGDDDARRKRRVLARAGKRSMAELVAEIAASGAPEQRQARWKARSALAAQLELDDAKAGAAGRLLRDVGEPEVVRRTVIEALATAGTQAAQKELAAGLGDDELDERVRVQVAQATMFMETADAGLIAALTRQLNGRHRPLRGASMGTLGALAFHKRQAEPDAANSIVSRLLRGADTAFGRAVSVTPAQVATAREDSSPSAAVWRRELEAVAPAGLHPRKRPGVAQHSDPRGGGPAAISDEPEQPDEPAQPDENAEPEKTAFEQAKGLLTQGGGEHWKARRDWLGALGNTGHVAILPAVLASLADEEPWVRAEAVHALRFLQTTKVLQPLVKALLTDADLWVRRNAVDALWHHGAQDLSTLHLLDRAMRFDVDTRVRAHAAYKIATLAIDTPTVRELFLVALQTEKDPIVLEALDAFTHPNRDLNAGTGVGVQMATKAGANQPPQLPSVPQPDAAKTDMHSGSSRDAPATGVACVLSGTRHGLRRRPDELGGRDRGQGRQVRPCGRRVDVRDRHRACRRRVCGAGLRGRAGVGRRHVRRAAVRQRAAVGRHQVRDPDVSKRTTVGRRRMRQAVRAGLHRQTVRRQRLWRDLRRVR